jgi:glyoxylase-like metal-dependent hydrolase (beta-lactamase superfamily II)
VRIVPTPGHTAGHLSVLVEEGPRTLLLAGDTSYTQANLQNGIVACLASMRITRGPAGVRPASAQPRAASAM